MEKKGVNGRAKTCTMPLQDEISVDRCLDPSPGEVVTHGQSDHNGQPKEAASDDNPGQPGAVADMHKIKDH